MINRIIVDGNDGTGKSTRVEQLKKMFHNIVVLDRGDFSKETLNKDIFDDLESLESKIARLNFRKKIKNNESTLYIILDADPEVCQKRIIERGDSINEPYHNMDDLIKYNQRFLILVDACRDLSNVMLIDTDE